MTWKVPNVVDDYPKIMENHLAYNEIRQEIEAKHFGKVALMHNKEIVGFFDTRGDAYSIGCEKYGVGKFRTQDSRGKTYFHWHTCVVSLIYSNGSVLCYAYFHRPGKEQLVQILRRRLFAPNTRGI